MPNHAATCPKSTMLCDQLFQGLRLKIPDLQIKNDNGWCSMWNIGGVIAWVSHSKIRGGIRVWFRGDSEKAKRISTRFISLKTIPITGAWGDCCGNFMVSKDHQLAEAVEALFAVSYPLSLNSNWTTTTIYKDSAFLIDHHPENEPVYHTV
jgi:hypothetical protein